MPQDVPLRSFYMEFFGPVYMAKLNEIGLLGEFEVAPPALETPRFLLAGSYFMALPKGIGK